MYEFYFEKQFISLKLQFVYGIAMNQSIHFIEKLQYVLAVNHELISNKLFKLCKYRHDCRKHYFLLRAVHKVNCLEILTPPPLPITIACIMPQPYSSHKLLLTPIII